MQIILSGAGGRMGHIVSSMAEQGFAETEIVAFIDKTYSGQSDETHFPSLSEYRGAADCVVDFSHHSATAELLAYCVERGLPLVLCTTGQTEEERESIRSAAEQIPVFFSANMSVGVAVLADLARRAAAMFPDADIEIVEKHHNQKLDVPSGTALMLARSIQEVREGATLLIGRHENGKRTKQEIGIHSLRLGSEVGTHEIYITTGNETITLRHEAENRALFAEGALRAAAFLCGKEPGLYTMKDMI